MHAPPSYLRILTNFIIALVKGHSSSVLTGRDDNKFPRNDKAIVEEGILARGLDREKTYKDKAQHMDRPEADVDSQTGCDKHVDSPLRSVGVTDPGKKNGRGKANKTNFGIRSQQNPLRTNSRVMRKMK